MGFPESFGMPEKQACASLFDSSERVSFSAISPGYDFNYHDIELKREITFTIQDTFRRDGYSFLKFLHAQANQGGVHAIGFGYQRIGIDILFIEFSQENNNSMITDAYLMQNLIPVQVSQSPNNESELIVTLSGFFASNEKVFILADNFIKARIAAQLEKAETSENNVAKNDGDKQAA
jgi:hypothetical protein